MSKMKLLLVCGPWGSGSSALTGLLANAGFFAPEPYHSVPDPLTPETFETDAFRLALSPFVSEYDLKKIGHSNDVIISLLNFKKDFLDKLQNKLPVDKPFFMLKHPTSAFFLDELLEIFDIKILIVLRNYRDIETTRDRRGWPSCFGIEGATVIYNKIFYFLTNNPINFHSIRYADLITKPTQVLSEISCFLDITLSHEEINRSEKFILNRAT